MLCGLDLVVAASQAILQQPLHHIGFRKELRSGGDLATGGRFAAIAQFGIDQGLALFLVELIGPADGVGISKCIV